ncbi:MAG: hypothetical protein HYZ54_06655 [Ignavibacteriae bacterium]|nr:hypothetical protein [Ignavibacteriota bacterium]
MSIFILQHLYLLVMKEIRIGRWASLYRDDVEIMNTEPNVVFLLDE